MLTPYDWQEAIGHRASYVESKLAQGAPVLALSIPDGIVIWTYKRQSRKIFELYDRLAFSAIGQQSDVEALRMAAVDFAHQEGFNRSEQDVTLQRVVTALSGAVKKAFADFSSSPVVARSLFAEVNASPESDQYSVLDYDGDFAASKGCALVASTEETGQKMRVRLGELAKNPPALKKALKELDDIWMEGRPEDSDQADDLQAEAILIERSALRENRFRILEG